MTTASDIALSALRRRRKRHLPPAGCAAIPDFEPVDPLRAPGALPVLLRLP